MAVALLVIGLWPLKSGHDARAWGLAAAAAFGCAAAVAPTMLRPFHRGWMTLGNVLGWVNTRILLGVLFYGLVTPLSLIMRVVGKRLLQTARDPRAPTYRQSKVQRPGTHFTHQF